MRLEDLRKIAEARNPGPWKNDIGNLEVEDAKRTSVCCMNPECMDTIDGRSVSNGACINNGDFIALAANTYDLLLDIAEAAADAHEELCYDKELCSVCSALRKLEEL